MVIGRLSAAVAVSISVLIGLGAAAPAPAALASSGSHAEPQRAVRQLPGPHWQAASWAVPGRPARPAIKVIDSSELDGVFCLTASDCWTVGYFVDGGALLNLVLHWTGTKWSQVAAPSPGGSTSKSDSQLSSVRCTSKANCWAVGYYDKGGAELSDALHWNGVKWSKVDTPNPGGTLKGDINSLMDVACTGPDNCWADGDAGRSASAAKFEGLVNFVLHWNGKKWSPASVPNPAGTRRGDINLIEAIRCTSASDCWAVGAEGKLTNTSLKVLNEILHWNGKKWTEHSVSSQAKGKYFENVIESISCLSASNCWASGVTTTKVAFVNETLHWNGHQWQPVAVPSPKGVTELASISCPAVKDCWAVGSVIVVASGDTVNEALHWTGHKWFKVTTPQPAGTASGDVSKLLSLRCTSTSNCWAVGQDHTSGQLEQGQILRWNGTEWVVG